MKTKVAFAFVSALACATCTRGPSTSAGAIRLANDLKRSEMSVFASIAATSRALRRMPGRHKSNKTFAATYQKDALGIYSNQSDPARSNVYIVKDAKIDKHLLNYLSRTDQLEPVWRQNNSLFGSIINWQYTYHIASNTIRIYPWHDLPKMFGQTVEWTMVKYFRNPTHLEVFTRDPFCTRPYIDAGGTGLGFSCCQIVDQEPSDARATIINCTDLGLQDSLAAFRSIIRTEQPDVFGVYIESKAVDIAYEPQVLFEVATGKVHLGKALAKLIAGRSKVFLTELKNARATVYLVLGPL